MVCQGATPHACSRTGNTAFGAGAVAVALHERNAYASVIPNREFPANEMSRTGSWARYPHQEIASGRRRPAVSFRQNDEECLRVGYPARPPSDTSGRSASAGHADALPEASCLPSLTALRARLLPRAPRPGRRRSPRHWHTGPAGSRASGNNRTRTCARRSPPLLPFASACGPRCSEPAPTRGQSAWHPNSHRAISRAIARGRSRLAPGRGRTAVGQPGWHGYAFRRGDAGSRTPSHRGVSCAGSSR